MNEIIEFLEKIVNLNPNFLILSFIIIIIIMTILFLAIPHIHKYI